MTVATTVKCWPLIRADASGELLVSPVGLSFWGGVDPVTGNVIDQHHPLYGQNLCGKILAIPSGRGSCSGSGAILEALLNNVAPLALVFCESEDILTLGVLAAQVLFERAIPVYRISPVDFKSLRSGVKVSICDDILTLHTGQPTEKSEPLHSGGVPGSKEGLQSPVLSESDKKMLAGADGTATQLAMQIVVRMAELQGAEQLVDVSQAHIDACVYHGPSSLMFAERLASLGAKVKVPTTLNSLSVDKCRWRQQGVDTRFGEAASALGDAYMKMGATLSYTCAPYLLESAPVFGEQIVWAESNAVTFANSIIGARTQKYPDFLDICIALTGRAPLTGAHLDIGRQPTLKIHIAMGAGEVKRLNATGDDRMPDDSAHTAMRIVAKALDDSFWPLLGYHIGSISSNDIPLITGLETLSPTLDDHKAFSAAFATTSSVPIYHIAGHTPEAETAAETLRAQSDLESIVVDAYDLHQSWQELNSATSDQVNLVCLGNPHLSLTECATLASLCKGRLKRPSVGVILTLGRKIYEQAERAGYVGELRQFGVQFINDTCWCMIEEPVIPTDAKVLMTNSGKYAHYGPGLVDRQIHFGGLKDCVDAACSGLHNSGLPRWLESCG